MQTLDRCSSSGVSKRVWRRQQWANMPGVLPCADVSCYHDTNVRAHSPLPAAGSHEQSLGFCLLLDQPLTWKQRAVDSCALVTSDLTSHAGTENAHNRLMRAGADLVCDTNELDLLRVLDQTGPMERGEEIVLGNVDVRSEEFGSVLRRDNGEQTGVGESVHHRVWERLDQLLNSIGDRARMVDTRSIVRSSRLLDGWGRNGPHDIG